MDSSSDSEQELFPIVSNEYVNSHGNVFLYNDPLMVSGVLRAVVEGDLQKVKYMVNSGKSVNINDNNGNTPLHVAVIKDNLEIIDYLLAHDDIVVNIRNFKGETPLYQAVRNGRLESTRRLILAGANVNLPNYEDVTPLHISVTQPELAHLLVLHGAHIDAVDYSRDAPLHDAVDKGCLETVCMLLFFGADANARGGNNLTPFMKALIAEHIEIQQALFEYVVDFNAATVDRMTTLALALTHDTPYVEEIIQRGANVNYVDMCFYEETACAFFLCLRVPNYQNFKLIWDKLNFNIIINTIDLCMLIDFLTKVDDIEKYIDVIIESDNVETAVASLIKNKNFFMFIRRFVSHNLKLEQLTKLTCRLILYGYHVTSYDIYEIFKNYGYCELFKMLLYMENNYDGWRPNMIIPWLIFDLDCKLSNVMDAVVDTILKREVPILLQYFNYPPLTSAFMHKYRDDEEMIQIISKLPRVPLLMEMARDKAREHIAKTFNTTSTCEFYTIVNYLNISNVYKKILKFEKKLYNI